MSRPCAIRGCDRPAVLTNRICAVHAIEMGHGLATIVTPKDPVTTTPSDPDNLRFKI